MTAPPDRRRRTVSRTELDLWRHAVRDAQPLPGRDLPGEPEPVAATPPDPVPVPVSREPAPVPKIRPASRDLPPLAVGAKLGTDKRTAERLRQGDMAIEGRIDLHGMTQDQAHGALTRFILAAFDDGKRCVLVITGKGYRDGQSGILRQATPRWLNTPPLRERVLSFTHAQPRHGGEGALYVLLKRRRT
jgi:DNA-nicking Smr family endonuclease